MFNIFTNTRKKYWIIVIFNLTITNLTSKISKLSFEGESNIELTFLYTFIDPKK